MKKARLHSKERSLKQEGKKNIVLFKILAIAIPFVVLILLEIGLRVFGYGSSYSLFVESPAHPGYYQMNPAVSHKYFLQQANATIGDRDLFKIKKDSNTLRLFVLGGSSAIGYPYFHNGSFHRWLKFRLMKEFPDANFEVINLALTAVNSYTLYDFTKQLVSYSPDAVLIYAGHNEYYGALGVASTSTLGQHPGWVRFVIALRKFRLVQLATNIYLKTRQRIGRSYVDSRENLMERMVKRQEIKSGSSVYRAGLKQFSINMRDILATLSQHKIPVFIGDVISNEKDQPPFISVLRDTAKAKIFFPVYNRALASMAQGDSMAAKVSLLRAWKIDSTYAACNYLLGQIAYRGKDYKLARAYFNDAVQYDCLRFRAPQAINDSIDLYSQNFPGVYFVDVGEEFRTHSPHRIIGRETVLEHLHPNLFGYALLSDAFYQSIIGSGLLHRFHSEGAMSFSDLWRDMPITAVDSLHGRYETMLLKEGWPFNEAISDSVKLPDSFEGRLAGAYSVHQIDWNDAMNSLLSYCFTNRLWDKARNTAEAMALEFPYNNELVNQCGKLCLMTNRLEDALFYFRTSFRQAPSMAACFQVISIYLKLDRPEGARSYFGYLESDPRSAAKLAYLKSAVYQISQLKSDLEKDSENVNIMNDIAGIYVNMGSHMAAEKYVEQALQIKPDNYKARGLQAMIVHATGEKWQK